MTVLLAADFFIQPVESKVPVEAACVYIRLYKQSVFGGFPPPLDVRFSGFCAENQKVRNVMRLENSDIFLFLELALLHLPLK